MFTILNDSNTACVILASGSCAPNILSWLRSLGKRGIPVYLVGFDNDLFIAKTSRYCAGFVCLPFGNEEDMANNLLAWRQQMGWKINPVLFFVSERLASMICSQWVALNKGFTLPMPAPSIMQELLLKDRSLEIARAAGLHVPQSYTISSAADVDDICNRILLPAIVKPLGANTLGRMNFKADIVSSKKELKRITEIYLQGGSRFVVQQYIPGNDSTLWVYLFYKERDSGKVHEWVGRKLRQSPPHAGIMAIGCAHYSMHIAEAGRRFLALGGYWGIGGVEFKEYNEKLYFIEMNPRSESIQLLAIADGIDLPAIAYADATGQEVARPDQQRNVSRYMDGEACLGNLVNCGDRFMHGKEILGQLFRSHLVCPVWSRDDPKPFICAVKRMVSRHCMRLFSLLVHR